jgi:hypothetical protein
VQANRDAFNKVASLPSDTVPTPFLLGVTLQESDGMHFHQPGAGDNDGFVTVGLDHNNKAAPTAITSRGYGIGQFTLFHHPPRPEEVSSFISDPAQNVTTAIKELREKFDGFIIGPADKADDRIHEAGTGPLRMCQFAPGDPRRMKACVQCLRDSGVTQIVAGQTPVFAGTSETYQKTQYHAGSYNNVPVRKNIPCDWPYAVRRYNGSGPNSYDYQAEILIKIAKLQLLNAVAGGG